MTDSAHRTLSFGNCQHNKGSNFHLQVRRENVKKMNFHFTQCLHRTLSPLGYNLFFETSMFTRKRATHKECCSPWSTSGHKSLPLTSSLLHQTPFWCRVSTRNADSSGPWVLLLGTCYSCQQSTRQRGDEKASNVFGLLTTQTSSGCCIASNTVILVVQVSGNKTFFFFF